MMDFVELLKDLKKEPGYEKSAVIAFGGSYGGMLAAWMRLKYPHVIQGAIAASAPVYFFPGYINPYAYTYVATQSYFNSSKNEGACTNYIREGFKQLNISSHNPERFAKIKEITNTC